MLSLFRHLLIDSWFGRVLVGLIFVVFALWGAESIFTSWSHRDANVVAWVGSKKVTLQELDSAARQQMQNYAAQQGFTDISQIPNMVKSSLVNQALQQLITEKNLIEQAEQSGLTVSDEALRNLVFSLPFFQKEGKFDRELFNSFLSQRNMPEAKFLDMLRNQLALSGLNEPLVSGAFPSNIMIQKIFAFRSEERKIHYIEVPFNHFTPNSEPSEAILRRYYDNHLWEFAVPEFRRVKLIFISPETVEKNLEISDDDVQQYYNSRKKAFNKPESRNLEILTVKDQKTAENLATSWSKDSWENVQKQTKKENGFATTFTEFSPQSSPSPELSEAVQKAPLNTISSPLKTPMGWSVFKVTAITPAHEVSFDSVKDKLKTEIAHARAKQAFPDNIKEIQDVIAGGEGLDGKLGGLGVVAVEGTLNEQGITLEGNPAPIPSDEKIKQAMLVNIFSKAKNAPPALIQGDNNVYYAFTVEDISPAHQENFEKAKDRVLKAWQQANIKRQANIATTAMLKRTEDNKKSVQDLGATQFPVKESEFFSRITPSKTLPAELQAQIFSMQVGQTTMFETPNSFIVATLSNIKIPNAQEDLTAYNTLKDTLKQAESDDIYSSYVIFINGKRQAEVNQQAIDNLVKQISYQ